MLRQILDSVVCVRFENGMLVFSLRMLVCMCVCEQCELEVVSCKREEEKKSCGSWAGVYRPVQPCPGNERYSTKNFNFGDSPLETIYLLQFRIDIEQFLAGS